MHSPTRPRNREVSPVIELINHHKGDVESAEVVRDDVAIDGHRKSKDTVEDAPELDHEDALAYKAPEPRGPSRH